MGRKSFKTIEEHDATVVENINSKVPENDSVLFILGDFCWKHVYKYRRLILCKNVVFILGNHDKIQASRNVFGPLVTQKIIGLENGQCAVLSHHPQIYWDKSHRGSYHFYGHTHNQREETLNHFFPERRSIDVGIDSAIAILGRAEPFSEAELMEILKDRKGHDPVEYYNGLRMRV
jgi:calcineurin-like phosphoesterase family protein